MHAARASVLGHDRAAVVPDDPERVQVRQQVHRVAVAEEGLGVRAQQIGVEVRQDGDLILAADAADDGLDLGIGERGVQIGGALGRGRGQHPGGGKLHGDQTEVLAQPAQSQLEGQREELGQAAGRGDDRDLVAGPRLRGILRRVHVVHACEATQARRVAAMG